MKANDLEAKTRERYVEMYPSQSDSPSCKAERNLVKRGNSIFSLKQEVEKY